MRTSSEINSRQQCRCACYFLVSERILYAFDKAATISDKVAVHLTFRRALYVNTEPINGISRKGIKFDPILRVTPTVNVRLREAIYTKEAICRQCSVVTPC